jgi:hypothetical protein
MSQGPSVLIKLDILSHHTFHNNIILRIYDSGGGLADGLVLLERLLTKWLFSSIQSAEVGIPALNLGVDVRVKLN